MSCEARYSWNGEEFRRSFDSEEEAAYFLKAGSDSGGFHPIGVWERGDKILCHDDILEWELDD